MPMDHLFRGQILRQHEGRERPPAAPAPLRDIEKQWIRTCEEHDSLRRVGDVMSPGPPDLLIQSLDRSIKAGVLTTAHIGVLVLAARRGHPPSLNCTIAYRLWIEAMEAIAADLRRGTVQ